MRDYFSVNIFFFSDIICWVPLRSTQPTEESDRTRIEFDSTVRHNGVAQKSIFGTEAPASASQVSISQVGIGEISRTQKSITEIDISQIGSLEVSTFQISSSQVDIGQISTPHDSISQVSIVQVGIGQIGFTQVNTSSYISSTQVNTTQVSPTQINPNKISLSSSIPFQEFFKNHNLPLALTNTYKDNPLNLWSTLFDPTFNINLQIADLPTGQLAEAQITNYDTLGRPNGGTILIDADANGIGWFIDPTPLDNTEFSQTLTDTAFRATTGDACGKYDLLTSILHEMGHLAGIISGYTEFDRHIQTVNGSKVFVGDNFTATLTKDGSIKIDRFSYCRLGGGAS